MRREADRQGPDRPEAAVRTCRPEQGGCPQPEGLRGLPGLPGGREQGGPIGVLRSLLLPPETPVDVLRSVAAESGAALSALRAAGPASQPGGGGEVGSRRAGALCSAASLQRR